MGGKWCPNNFSFLTALYLPSVPIAFGEPIAVALLFAARGDPHGTRVWRQLPIAGHPLIALVAPSPIARHPDIVGSGLSQHYFRLQRRRGHGHHGGADGGRGRCNQQIAGTADDGRRHCIRSGRGGGGRNRANWRRWRWFWNNMRLRLSRTTGQKAECTASDQNCCDPRYGVEGGWARERSGILCFHFFRILLNPSRNHGVLYWEAVWEFRGELFSIEGQDHRCIHSCFIAPCLDLPVSVKTRTRIPVLRAVRILSASGGLLNRKFLESVEMFLMARQSVLSNIPVHAGAFVLAWSARPAESEGLWITLACDNGFIRQIHLHGS